MKIIITCDPASPDFNSTKYQQIDSYHSDVYSAIQAALRENGHQAEMVCVDDGLPERVSEIHPDFAVNCSCEARGKDHFAYAPGYLEKHSIPFTGSGGEACFHALDKSITKKILLSVGIRTPRAVVIRGVFSIEKIIQELRFPLFIKPVKGGCSYGINGESLILNHDDLQERLSMMVNQVDGPMLLEEYLPGREVTVGMMGNQALHILPIMEFEHKQTGQPPFRSYQMKMIQPVEEETCCPADLNSELHAEIVDLACRTFRALDCKDYARIDFRLDQDGLPCVLEVNALPNLMPGSSSFALMAEKDGMDFNMLIREILALAQIRYRR